MTQRTVNDILTELKSQAIHPFNEEPPPIVINEKDGSPMVLIPAGSFAMGDGLDKESPERTLFLDSYYIGGLCRHQSSVQTVRSCNRSSATLRWRKN